MAEELIVDLSNYKDRVGQRVPQGRYDVIVDDVELDKSNAGNDMINVWFRITGGEYDGAIIIDRLTQTEKALFRTVGFMQAIGLQTPKKRLRINIGQWRNRKLQIDVEDGEPYNGRVKSEVRGYNRIVGGPSASDTSGDLDGLDEFAAADEDVETPVEDATSEAATAPTSEAAVESDDDVDLESVDLR